MAKSGEFYTFDEVVRQLKIDENKLKRLVSEGEISAFREGDVMKFKRSEIDKLSTKGGSETSETVLSEITLEDEAPAFEESGETLTDDLVFESSGTEDQIDLGADTSAPAPEEISSQDTFIEDAGGGADDVGMTTEPIDLSADLTEEVEEEEIEEVEAPAQRSGTPRTQRRPVDQAPAGNPGMTFALVVGSVMLLLCVILAWRASSEGSSRFEGTMQKTADVFYDNFGTKKKVRAQLLKDGGELNSVEIPAEERKKMEEGCGSGDE